uniref:Uncharacterized protein n=1 Tax=Fervidobacterium thailandense TaxID=1008305 RepID=A0A7C4GJN6_9BACT
MLKNIRGTLAALLLLISVSVGAFQISIPQGMNFIFHIRSIYDLITILNEDQSDEKIRQIPEIVNLPEMITVTGKFSNQLLLSNWELLLNDSFNLETILSSFRKLPIIFVFPADTRFESIENFLMLLEIVSVQFDEKSEKYVAVITEEGIGHIYKLESGVYLTFSDTMARFLELLAENINYSHVLEIPDDALVYHEALNLPILGMVFYLLGDIYGTPQSEKGYLRICEDQSVEAEVFIKKEVSQLERELISKLTNIKKHFTLENATIRLLSVEPFNALALKSITPLTLFPIEPNWVESVALSLLTCEDKENTQMVLSIKPKATYEDKVFSSVAHLSFPLDIKEGFVLVRTENAVLTKADNVVTDDTVLYAELFNMKIHITRATDDVTKISVKIPKISDFLRFFEEEIQIQESEDIFNEKPYYPFEFPEEDEEESSEEVLSETDELIHKFANLLNSFIQSMLQEGEWNVTDAIEFAGVSREDFDFVQLIDKTGNVHAMFLLYLDVDDQDIVFSSTEKLSNLLNTTPDISLSISPVGTKLVVILHFLK